MKKLIFFILIIAVVGVVIYSVVTQISGTIHLGGVFSPELFNYSITPSTSTSVKDPPVSPISPVSPLSPILPWGVGGKDSGTSGARGTVPEKPKITPPAGFALTDLSPYYQKVRFSNVTPPKNYYSPTSVSRFSLRGATGTSTLTIDVSGWEVKGNNGTQVYIPQAINSYSVNAYGTSLPMDVILTDGTVLTLYSSKSPVGVNFRLNKCIGYLSNEYNFSPSLPQNCPSVNRVAVSTFSGECQSFIFSLYGCKEPTPTEKNRYSYDSACYAFLNKLNYRECYIAHRNDFDFLSNEWRIWTDREMPFNSEHDRLLLLDKNGLLVDMYTY